MRACSIRKALAIAAVVLVSSQGEARAQAAPANCTYESCALGLAPRWDGLAITRGISQRPIANLGFFYPGDIRPVFADNPQALEAAEQAIQARTVGAILTDAGLVLLVTGLARAGFQREFDGLSKALTFGGAASIGVSIPFQFAADGYLSRAVWWHNRRFAR
jgi:hypothetical protein